MKPVFNRTKVIATIGPASSSEEILTKMFMEGVDVCRLNFSHGAHEEHLRVMQTIRKINDEYGLNVSILCDLQGPKIRIGALDVEYIDLLEGDKFCFTTNKEKEKEGVAYITYQNFAQDVAEGDKVLLDDGKLVLRVTDTNRIDMVETEVVHGGPLYPKKGVNLPSTKISLPCLTEKDLADLDFILDHSPDWIALSFVRESYDIIALRQILEAKHCNAKIIAKIEKPQALENIDSIIDATDAIMVARGDLGVEVPIEEMPMAQKSIVSKCLIKSKPVIIATQIMESMITSPQPTRAEINDVANAVLDGADALMVSGETSVGKFPVGVIRNMQKIIGKVEDQSTIYDKDVVLDKSSETFLSDALCKTAVRTSITSHAKAIVSMTVSGYTAFKISSFRPRAHTYIFTGNKKLLTQISLIWGVRGFYYDKYQSTDQTIEEVNRILQESGFVDHEDIIINTASMPIKERSRTNTIKISIVK
ncbi:MAG: pyruvate kinase [Bacteroidia bacterium]